MKGRDFYHNASTNEMELVKEPSPHVSSSEKNLRTINELKDLKKHQDSTNIYHPSYGAYQEPTVGTTAHRKKYPERYGHHYTSKLEQAAYPKPGTAPSEKSTYPFDTPKGIDHVTKIMKEEADHKLSPAENKDIDILNKEMKLSVLKDEIGGLKKFDNLNPDSYPSSPEQGRRLKNIDKLEKSLGYNSQEINVPYKKDTRSPNTIKKDAFEEKKYNIKQRLKNTRGLSDWELITKTAKTPQEKREVREIVNNNYKRDPSSIFPEDRKWLDKGLVEPVKITEYPEVVLGSPPEVPQTTINRNSKPVEQIVSELANERLVREQRNWDHHYGKGGITSLKRPE